MSSAVLAAEPVVSDRQGSGARPRRSGWRLVAGALVTVAAAAGFGLFQTATDGASGVLVVARPVPAGGVIAAADVRVARVELPPGVEAVPAGRAGSVVGATAATPLVPGALLAAGQVGTVGFPATGEAVVAVSVGLPPAGLSPGSRVRVLVTGSSGTGGQAPVLLVPASSATVVAVGGVDGAGARAVSLLLSAGAGEQVAAAAAAGVVSLVMVAPG